jgi:16S rRNA (cytidine1402-2'-O)-methyltransferase
MAERDEGQRRAGPGQRPAGGHGGVALPGQRRAGGHGGVAPPGQQGVLTLAAVPIGRAEDASPRLAAELARATLIAAEDTRRVRWLAASLNVPLTARIVSYYDAVETRRTPGLLSELQAGQDVLLVTDAGTPGISDPGYRLVAAAAAAGVRVTALPGPSAVTTALAVSGLPTDRFSFEGFPPRRPGERQRRFAELAGDRRTQVYFESGRRLASTLTELAASHGEDRQAVVCRELTKIHEQIVRGTLAELAMWAGSGAVRGEITLVVAGTARRSRDRPGVGGPADRSPDRVP